MYSQHWSMPFGAVGSVVAWDRIVAMIWYIESKLLHIPLMRCVMFVRIRERASLLYCLCKVGR